MTLEDEYGKPKEYLWDKFDNEFRLEFQEDYPDEKGYLTADKCHEILKWLKDKVILIEELH